MHRQPNSCIRSSFCGAGKGSIFSVLRPNTGESYFDMEVRLEPPANLEPHGFVPSKQEAAII